jgi:predicted NAD/FAD-dependent oxidoreductase
MLPQWALMAVTDDLDWPWDAAEPAGSVLQRVVREDRKPGAQALPGRARWTAQATPKWTAAHLDDDPQDVAEAMRAALRALLPAGARVAWHHTAVHRWRHARCTDPADPALCLWDGDLGLGVCGDHLAGGEAEGAWRSGDELADALLAAHGMSVPPPPAHSAAPEAPQASVCAATSA